MRFQLFVFLFSLMVCKTTYSQDIPVNVVQNNLGIDYQIRDFVVNTKRQNNSYGEKFTGSFFLFDDWTNNCKIQLSGKQFRLNNVNFNVDTNEFMSDTEKDSVFSIDSRYIDFIAIGDKKFVYKVYKGQNKFFEALLEAENGLSFFKGYDIRVIPKSEMGMLNRPYDEIKKKEKYFILNNNQLVNISLKKKEVLKHIKKDNHNKILKYVKEKKLSFKKEKDVKEIFKYYNTLYVLINSRHKG